MKKLLFVCIAMSAGILFTNTTRAQAIKIGYFDEEAVLGLFPDINRIDTLMSVYRQDSLGEEFTYRLKEFQRADSIFKKDSVTLTPKQRDMAQRDLYQKQYVLANWQQYAQEMSGAKQDQLLQPYRQKLADALKAIVAEGKYTIVLNQAALVNPFYAQPPIADNLSLRVALRLKLPVGKDVEDAFKAATGTGGTTTKPAGAKN